MPIADTVRFYFGVVTGSSGENTAESLSYDYVADDIKDPDNKIRSTQPAIPRRPFSGAVEIEEPLQPGAAIMVFQNGSTRTLILIDQEKYAVTECEDTGGRPLGMMRGPIIR